MKKKIIIVVFACFLLIATALLSHAGFLPKTRIGIIADKWDNLDTPDDISGSAYWYNQTMPSSYYDIFVNETGDNMTGPLSIIALTNDTLFRTKSIYDDEENYKSSRYDLNVTGDGTAGQDLYGYYVKLLNERDYDMPMGGSPNNYGVYVLNRIMSDMKANASIFGSVNAESIALENLMDIRGTIKSIWRPILNYKGVSGTVDFSPKYNSQSTDYASTIELIGQYGRARNRISVQADNEQDIIMDVIGFESIVDDSVSISDSSTGDVNITYYGGKIDVETDADFYGAYTKVYGLYVSAKEGNETHGIYSALGDNVFMDNVRIGASTGEDNAMDGDDAYVLGSLEVDDVIYADKMLKLKGNSTVFECNVDNEGTIYYNNNTHKHYGCNSTDWNVLY